MADTFSKSARSQIMRDVHSTGSGAEKACETLLRSLKLSFRRTFRSSGCDLILTNE